MKRLVFIFFLTLFFLTPARAADTFAEQATNPSAEQAVQSIQEPLILSAQALDTDGDGLTDEQEINIYHTNPNDPDTDTDGFEDGIEIKNNFSPLVAGKKIYEADYDEDGLSDGAEFNLGADPTNKDTDGDGYPDGVEVRNGYDPVNPEPIKLPKSILVDLKTQTLTYFLGDKKIENFLISSGIARLPTPKGEFKVLKKKPIVHYKGPGYDLPNTKWNLLFSQRGGGIFIHGAYWHNKFGQPMSHGCVNVSYKNMEPLYAYAEVGTKVIIK